MAISVSIQETTITPSNGGYVVHLNISDKPVAALDAALLLTLRVEIPQADIEKLSEIQKAALNEMLEALKPLMSALYG